MNPAYTHSEARLLIRLEADEPWSYVQKKRNPRWRWWVEDPDAGAVVAFLFGPRTTASFRRLLALLTQAGIAVSRWFTDYWWAYHVGLSRRVTSVNSSGRQRSEATY